jgi:hypothetical protein
MEDSEELETAEPSLNNAMEVEDITTVNSIHEQVSCCVDHTEGTPEPAASKPKLVIGLGQTETGHLKASEDALDLDKDDDFMNLDDDVTKLASLNRSKADEVVGPGTLG